MSGCFTSRQGWSYAWSVEDLSAQLRERAVPIATQIGDGPEVLALLAGRRRRGLPPAM